MRDTHFPTHYLSSGERDVYRQLGEEDAGGGIEEKSSKSLKNRRERLPT